jgi:hypothetical protein
MASSLPFDGGAFEMRPTAQLLPQRDAYSFMPIASTGLAPGFQVH